MNKITRFLFLLSLMVLSACSSSSLTETTRQRPVLGSAQAPVLIEEFSDLQCPACAFITPQVEGVVKMNPGLARLEYFHFPLPQHQYAFAAAEASECAADQGKFWEYVDLVFENQKQLNGDLLYTLAKTLKLDEALFKSCLDTNQTKERVKTDLAEGRRRQVRATPTLYVNGQEVRFSGYESFENYLKSLAIVPSP